MDVTLVSTIFEGLPRQGPGMMTEAETVVQIRDLGYRVIGSFRLPGEGWWDHYDTPLSRRIPSLKETYAQNPGALAIVVTRLPCR